MGPSIEALCRDCTQQHMAELLETLKRINSTKTLDSAVHKAIGEEGKGVKWGLHDITITISNKGGKWVTFL